MAAPHGRLLFFVFGGYDCLVCDAFLRRAHAHKTRVYAPRASGNERHASGRHAGKVHRSEKSSCFGFVRFGLGWATSPFSSLGLCLVELRF